MHAESLIHLLWGPEKPDLRSISVTRTQDCESERSSDTGTLRDTENEMNPFSVPMWHGGMQIAAACDTWER